VTAPLVVILYAMHPTDRAGAVVDTGANLAKLVGMSPTVFSRTRRQVVEAGWLEESERLAHISYYRLSEKSTGEDVAHDRRRAEEAVS
jgi:DNA-binding transcriptional regulator PaaX